MSNTDVASIFRREVINARANAALGSIRLSQPLSTRLIAAFSVSIAISIGIFAYSATYTKRARVVGITVPISGQISVASPYAGTIKRLLVTEGADIKKGQPIVEIASDRQTQQGSAGDLVAEQLLFKQQTLEKEMELSETLKQQTMKNMDIQLNSFIKQKVEADTEIKIVRRRLAIAISAMTDYERLHKDGFMSSAHVQQKQNESLDIESRLSALGRTVIELDTNIQNLLGQKYVASADLASKKMQLDKAMTSLRQEAIENASRATAIVVAANDGIISAINFQIGQNVAPGQTIAMLLPTTRTKKCSRVGPPSAKKTCQEQVDTNLYIQLFATSKTSGFVMSGQKVLIKLDAFPYQKFGLQHGEVLDVSRTPFAPNELPTSIASSVIGRIRSAGGIDGEGLYRISVGLKSQTIGLYGRETRLKPGMMLEADVSLDERAVWEWVLEPVLGMRARH